MRGLGVVPWIGLGAWALLTAMLEPPVLRSSGVRLREAACWSAAVVLWWVLVSPPSGVGVPSRFGVRLGAHLGLLGIVGVIVALLGAVLGFISPFGHGPSAALLQWVWFVGALSPLATAVSIRTQGIMGNAFTIVLTPLAGLAIPGLWLAPEGVAALTAACSLSLAAAVLAVFASSGDPPVAVAPRGSSHANRHSR